MNVALGIPETSNASTVDVAAATPALEVEGVYKRFGGLQALADVGVRIAPGEIYGFIGPNGAGKTTFFNVITGLYQPDAGKGQ